MKKLKSGDQVIVLAGKNKNEKSVISRVLKDGRLIVSGVKMVKKHIKPNPMSNTPGGIVEKESPIQVSNVAIYNSATGKADRVGFKVLESGKKVRIFKSTKEVIESN